MDVFTLKGIPALGPTRSGLRSESGSSRSVFIKGGGLYGLYDVIC